MSTTPERTPLASAIRYVKGAGTNLDASILALAYGHETAMHSAARILADELERVQASDDHARQLLHRWHEWARAHGHDIGILDDTRAFLFPKP